MDTIPLWCIIFINCITLLSSVWILIYLYRNRSKKSFSTYIYGIASLIGLFLGVISFFYYICHAFCAILFGIEIFIDTYMEQKKSPVNRTYFKITIPHPYVLKGYYCGIGFMFYGIMVILYYMILLMETVLLKMRSFIYNPMRHILYLIILYQTQKAMPLSLRPIQEET